MTLLSLLEDNGKSLVVGTSGDADSLSVDEASVPLRVLVGKVQWIGGERLGTSTLLEKEGGVVAGHGPCDVVGHND